MVALNIVDVKSFMSNLLIQNVFDNFLLSELDILNYNYFSITGRLNMEWYSAEEIEGLEGREYSRWAEIKPIAYQLIKGNRTPQSFKIVFLLSKENMLKILKRNGGVYRPEEINGLFLNIKYEQGILSLTTGISMKIFTMDKTLEHEWDGDMKTFLKHYEIAAEEL